jgi:Protein of unknown function (DUF3990)
MALAGLVSSSLGRGINLPLPGILPWTDQEIILYHGTIDADVASITRGVDLNRCKHLQDFGRGFYTSTNQQQAERWAQDRANRVGYNPAVISFAIDRHSLALLDSLFFVRGDPSAFDFWSLIQYCRTINGDHNRPQTPWYDVVAGPVTGSWKKQTVIPKSDQISFHTPKATSIIDSSQKARVL